MPSLKRIFRKMMIRLLLEDRGYEVVKTGYEDMEADFHDAWGKCRDCTMTPIEVGYALYQAVNYAVDQKIPGCFVECGVWKGGSSMLAAEVFKRRGDIRDIHMYDTYAGMSEPTEHDVSSLEKGETMETWKKSQEGLVNRWCFASLEDVKANVARIGYPADRVTFVKGKVEDTLAHTVPAGDIAVLRLDTDWYESTKAEMDVLYSRLVPGGVLILDDYGFWKGSAKAVDEYFATHGGRPLLNRVNFGTRMGLKP